MLSIVWSPGRLGVPGSQEPPLGNGRVPAGGTRWMAGVGGTAGPACGTQPAQGRTRLECSGGVIQILS